MFHGFCNSGEITKMTDVTVSSKVSDVTFFPSKDGHGYDVVMTSQELPEIYCVQLSNGKITTLKGNLFKVIQKKTLLSKWFMYVDFFVHLFVYFMLIFILIYYL